MDLIEHTTQQNQYYFVSKKELMNLIDFYPNIKNDVDLYQTIKRFINILDENKCEHMRVDNDCDTNKDLQKIVYSYNYIHLIENAILFSIINHDIDMKFRLEFLYKIIWKKKLEDYRFNIFEEINKDDELVEYIKKNKQYIKSIRKNVNR